MQKFFERLFSSKKEEVALSRYRIALTEKGNSSIVRVQDANGQRLGRGERIGWSPRPGRHELAWNSTDGRSAQRVRFEVRGASLRAALRASN